MLKNKNIAVRATFGELRTISLGFALAAASFAFLPIHQAHAACSVTTGTGTATAPDSGATVTCTTDAPNPVTDGIDDQISSDGVTVILQSGAGISTTGNQNEGIFLDNGATIELQDGAFIRTTGNNAEGIDVDNNATVTLRSGSSITTTGNGAEGMDLRGNAMVTVEAGATVSAAAARAIQFRSGTLTIGGTVFSGNNNAIRRNSIGGSTINILAGANVSSMSSVAISLLGGADILTIAGTVAGGGATAIQLGGGNDRLELLDGFNINGIVNAQGGGGDTLVFGGDQDAAFDVSNIGGGQQYRNFENFEKGGASTWTLTGTTGAIGTLDVNSGRLLLDNASLTSTTLDVMAGATLGGTGDFSSIFTHNGSIISPGGAPGEIGTLTGTTVLFVPGFIYEVDIMGPNLSDRVVTSGGVGLIGGTINVRGDLASAAAGQQYVILDTGGLAGTFDGVTPSAFIDYSLTYNPTQALLNIDARRGFITAALTPNQQQAAMALDGLDGSADANEIENAILGMSLEEARAAFEAIAGGAHAEGAAGALESAEDFTQFLLAFSGSGSAGTTTTTLGVPAAGYGADLLSTGSTGPTFWYGGFGGYAELDSDGNGGGHENNTFGLAGGVETDVDFADAVLGFSLGYSFTDLDVSGRLQEVEAKNFHAGLYARMGADRQEGFAARGALTYSHHWLDTTRTIAFGGISRTAEASYNGYTLAADVEARYNMAVDVGVLDNTFLSPFARVQLGHTDLGSFTETGAGALNLSGDADGYNRATAALGVSFTGEREIMGTIWRPSVSVAYEYAAGDEAEANLTLGGSPTTFVTKGADESRHRVRFGTLSEFVLTDRTAFTLATDSVWSEDRTEISAKAGVKFTF
jgi:hypothetical protein